MAKERKDKHFIKKPTYVGGPAALKKFIRENQRYPKAALEQKVEGTVVVRYDINHKGKVIGAKIISGIGHGCNEEAKRLVKLLKFEVFKNRGIRVKFHRDLKIHFRLPKVKEEVKPVVPEQATGGGISYTVTSSKKGKDSGKTGGVYSYTIKY